MQIKKNIILGKNNFFYFIILFYIFFDITVNAQNKLIGNYVEIVILDKVNSKSSTLVLKIGKEEHFKNLKIKALKCKNSEFDDNPEITAYLQVVDKTIQSKDKVFIFNDWTFASSPSLKPFDHPIYDIWLKKCFN